MARTKNRYKEPTKIVENDAVTYRAAIYARLSEERTESYREKSSSIDAQEIICRNYAEKHNISIVNVYIDYKKTGTNFERAGYQEMMNDVRHGLVNCIIIRDLSRLGREYLEMGRLIDKVFPVLGVRFISVNDNLDSLEGIDVNKNFEVCIKNIVNAMYSKDISVKLTTLKRDRAQRGVYIGSIAPYGYNIQKVSGERKLVVNEEVRDVIKLIFESSAQGYTTKKIVQHLNSLNLNPPKEYQQTRMKYKIDGSNNEWLTSTVFHMLNNTVYCGVLSQYRGMRNLKTGKKYKKIDKENWFVFKNAHEAIIDQELFDKAKKRRKENYPVRKTSKYCDKIDYDYREPINRYEGLMYCANGKKLYRRYRHKYYGDYKIEYYFISKPYEYGGKEKRIRIKECIVDKLLINLIAEITKKLVSKKEILKKIEDDKKIFSSRFTKEKLKIDSKIAYQKRTQKKLYEDYVFGKLSKSDYLLKIEDSKIMENILKNEIENLDIKQKELEYKNKKAIKFIESIYNIQGITKLSKEMIQSLVEHIEVKDNTTIDVQFTCNLFKQEDDKYV